MIDNTLTEYADCPSSLNGEIMLERTYSDDGTLTGWITMRKDAALSLQAKTDEDLNTMGYGPAHIAIIRGVK
jgi:hypothetical protein